jgi:hypothetical protein
VVSLPGTSFQSRGTLSERYPARNSLLKIDACDATRYDGVSP